jgi:hypothetical protein
MGSSIPAGNFPDFFGGFRETPVLSGRIRREIIGKILKIPGGNTASMFQIFPVFSCRIW